MSMPRVLRHALQTSIRHYRLLTPARALSPHKSIVSHHSFPRASAHFCTNQPPVQAGFSYPGPRKLSEIVKIQLLNKHTSKRVREIWEEYHKDHKSAVGDVLTKDDYGLFMERTKRLRHFVLPVPRESGYFTLIVQFQGKQCFMTYLEDYKKNTQGAQPYLTLTFFDEMVETKGVALMRAEVTNMLTRAEGKVLVELLKQFYLGSRRNYDAVVAFNEDADKFDFKSVLRVAGIAS